MVTTGCLLSLAAILTNATPGANTCPDGIEISSRTIHLADVMDVSDAPHGLRDALSSAFLGEMDSEQTEARLSLAWIAQRTRTAVPAIAPLLDLSLDGTVELRIRPTEAASPAEAPRPTSCAQVMRDLRVGDTPTAADFTPADCVPEPVSALRYDPRAEAVSVSREIEAGAIIIAPPRFALADLRAGQTLRLSVAVGAVVVEREVEALQPGRRGEPLFVQTHEGDVLLAPFPETAQ